MGRTSNCILAVLLGVSLVGTASAQQPPPPWPAEFLTTQVPLAPAAVPQFAQPLPVLDVSPEPLWAAPTYPKIATVLPGEIPVDPITGTRLPFTLKMCEFKANVLPPGAVLPPLSGATSVWGYVKGACPPAGTPRDTYLGPVFVNVRGTPTPIKFVNELPATPEASSVIAYKDSIDQTLHWADPNNVMCSMHGAMGPPTYQCSLPFRGTGIPAVPHLHGGEVPPGLDGGPDAWFLSTGTAKGPTYYTDARGGVDPAFAVTDNEAIYTYPNTQEAGPLWFHDHTLGATRLNVFAGLAGGYYLLDPAQDVPAALKDPTQIVPIILQDRMFDTKGELFFTSGSKGGLLWALNPEHPYWNPEFVGDVIAVNGKVWPFLQVQPKKYRFLFLNGSNARTYELFLQNRVTKVLGPSMYVIGTDGGYLNAAVKIDPNALKPAPTKLVIMPGERYEVVIDFTGLPVGTNLFLKNVARTPYPAGGTPTGGMDKAMEFRVTCPPGTCPTAEGLAYDPAQTPTIRGLGSEITPLVNFAAGTPAPGLGVLPVRQLTLNEVMGMPVLATDPVTGLPTQFPGGPLEVLVNNTKWGAAISETPAEGATEIWEIVNLTADSHPMHLHLVQFQLVNRQNFDLPKYTLAYDGAFPGGVYLPGHGPPGAYDTGVQGAKLGGNPDVAPYLKGLPRPAALQETGWKDTVQVPPGMVTRLLVRFAPTEVPAGEQGAYPFVPADPTANYVWHCHIIDHEDNEMMRPYVVAPNAGATRTVVKGFDY